MFASRGENFYFAFPCFVVFVAFTFGVELYFVFLSKGGDSFGVYLSLRTVHWRCDFGKQDLDEEVAISDVLLFPGAQGIANAHFSTRIMRLQWLIYYSDFS